MLREKNRIESLILISNKNLVNKLYSLLTLKENKVSIIEMALVRELASWWQDKGVMWASVDSGGFKIKNKELGSYRTNEIVGR